MVEDKKLEYKFDEIYHEVIISLDKLYKKSGMDFDNSGFASYVLGLAFLLSSKSYFDTLMGSGGNKDIANLALLNTFSNIFKDEFLNIVSSSLKNLKLAESKLSPSSIL